MVHAKPLSLTVAPPAACSPLLRCHVVVAGVGGEVVVGSVAKSVAMDNSMMILHRNGRSVGCVEFGQDFDHIRVRGSTETFLLKDVILIEIP